MSNNEETKFPYPIITNNKLKHPLLLPIIPRIVIRQKNSIDSESSINNINVNNMNNDDYNQINKKDYSENYKLNNKNNDIIHNKNDINDINYNISESDNKNDVNKLINNNINIKKIIGRQNNIFPNKVNQFENEIPMINKNYNNLYNKNNIERNVHNNVLNNHKDIEKINNNNILNNNRNNYLNIKPDISDNSKIKQLRDLNDYEINLNKNENIIPNINSNININNENNKDNINKIKVLTINEKNKMNSIDNNLYKHPKQINSDNILINNNLTKVTNELNPNLNNINSKNIPNNLSNINQKDIIQKNIINKSKQSEFQNNSINPKLTQNNNRNIKTANKQSKFQNNNQNNETNILPQNIISKNSEKTNDNKVNNNYLELRNTNNLMQINNSNKQSKLNTIEANKIQNPLLNNPPNSKLNSQINKKTNDTLNNQLNTTQKKTQKSNQNNNNINNLNDTNSNYINNTNNNNINNNNNNNDTNNNNINNNNNNNNNNINNNNININKNNNINNNNINNNNTNNSNNNNIINPPKTNSQKNPLIQYPLTQKIPSSNIQNNLSSQPYVNKAQNTFKFETVTITSEFNSGNMFHCKKISEDTYNIQIASDCQDKELDHQIPVYKVWFYFGVQSTITRDLNINIINLNNFLRVYKSGYQICIRELEYNVEPKDFENSYNLNEEIYWKRFDNFTASIDKENHLILKIKQKFEEKKYILFSFCFPFSYDKNISFLNYLDDKINKDENSKIYFHKETLIQSKEKRNVNLITITSKENIIKNQQEQNIIGLFPDKNRCLKTLHDKPIVIISARVHPGETPGSHMMNGILKLLTNELDYNSEILRNNFIFKIIPMINVDGVSIGNYRLDNNGYNLNRCYLEPDVKKEPEIYGIKKLFILYNNIYKVRYYFDLHADMNVRGAYTYGNAIEKFESHVENVLFGFIFHLCCSHINWNHCIYSESSMKTKFKNDNNSKEATSRVHFYKKSGLIHTYTLESSYFKGDFIGVDEKENDKLYLISDFEKTGRDCLIAILCYEELIINENIANSNYFDISGCREYIANYIQMSEDRFNLNFALKNIAKEINKRRVWKSIKEINEKYQYGKNKNFSQKVNNHAISLPKINKKLDSERLNKLPLINNEGKDNESNEKEYNDEKRISGIKKGRKNLTPIDNYNNNNGENYIN